MKQSYLIVSAAAFACAACHSSRASPQPYAGPVDAEFPHPDGGPGAPLVPKLGNVAVDVDDDRVAVRFAPVDGAADYRIFPLPDGNNVSVDPTGMVTVKNQIYSCSGDREAPNAPLDTPDHTGSWASTHVATPVVGYNRTAAEATLGYVYIAPAADRVPIYAAGRPSPTSDNACDNGFGIWAASRVKTYTSSKTTYDQLVSAAARDDGIVFYAPVNGDVQVMTAGIGNSTLYYSSAAEVAARSSAQPMPPMPAFLVLSQPSADTVPLKRVYYEGFCFDSHDELVAGEARFQRAAKQGNQPIPSVQWSGITANSLLVVEALDKGCPFQGHLSPAPSAPAGQAKAFVTIGQVQAASATGEVFINGQHDPLNKPRAIARSFIRASPVPRPAADFSARFGDPGETFTLVKEVTFGGAHETLTSPTFDAQFYTVEPTKYAIGSMLGELWVDYADWASDTNGKFRLTPHATGTLSASLFLHVSVLTNTSATTRRYPQILVSDVASPVQDNLPKGTTIILQPFNAWPSRLEVQVCDHRTWDVNNQCPRYALETTASGSWLPHDPAAEHASAGLLTRLDLLLSTQTAYVFLDGLPYGCAMLTKAPAVGPVTVTLGDTLYHSSVDEMIIHSQSKSGSFMSFHYLHQLTETRRHFDNFEFSSNQGPPAWDPVRFPCTATLIP
jgi:hypothetical protein